MAAVIDVIRTAAREIGVTEFPSTSNNVKYNTAYYGREVYGDEAYPWCQAFIWWVFREAGAEELMLKTASCPTLARWAQSEGRWIERDFRPGDVLLFRFYGTSGYDHTGIVETVNADGTYTTIEGNTSLTSDDNGGAVMRRTRYKSQIVGAYRPEYDEPPEPEAPAEKEDDMTYEQFREYMARYESELAEADGSAWSETERAWATENGMFIGGEGGKMRWKSSITREELAAVEHRLHNQ